MSGKEKRIPLLPCFPPGDALAMAEGSFLISGKSDPSEPRGIVCGVLTFPSEQTSAQDAKPSLAPSSPVAFVM